jgi:outer membrane receptor for ferrienterochelin and colicin
MSVRRSSLFRAIVAAAVFTLMATSLFAQLTTGNLAGTVSSSTDKSVLPGVTVEAVHVPTGTRYDTVSGANGRYVLANIRVGGPYRVTGTLEGFKTATVNVPDVKLGATTEVPLNMALAAVTEAITVTAAAYDVVNPNRTGSTSQVTEEQIQTLPTVNRSLQDYARTNPYFVVDPSDPTGTLMNVAGRNNRYNSILIDGAVNNDLFGLAASGTPGGQANTQPISLDALEQLQLVVSPYDVRQGGFTGGGVNVVTRSGTNDFHGSVFYAPRTEQLVGDLDVNGVSTSVANFEQKQYGGRFGGPIMRDRLFFFGSGEINRRQEPTGIAADGTSQTPFNANVAADAAALRQFLITNYSYDPGELSDFPKETNSDLAFLRFDWNANNSNQITLRHNYVKAGNDIVANRNGGQFRFPTATYNQADETNSSVAQINSVFGANAFNEARVTFQTIRDVRAVPVVFPSIEIGGAEQNPTLSVGTERFSGANSLDQDILELTDDFTFIKGNHSLTVGTHNEFFEFKNLFLSEFYGYYHFPNLAAFTANNPDIYRISFANGSDPRRPTQFKVRQYGLYVSDNWHASPNLTLTLGIRGDLPSFETLPSENPLVQTAIGFNTAQTAKEDWVLSPRIGFNWSIPGATRSQVRGGVGVFAGRTPYVWISNAYANTGVEASSLGCLTSTGCTPPKFNPNVDTQPRTGSGATPSVDLIDSDFEFPRVLRTTLGYDRDLFWGISGTVELLYSQTQKDVFYYNVNRVRNGLAPTNIWDGRPQYRLKSTALLDAIQLANTSKGHEFTQTLQFSRPFRNGVNVSANYAHQSAHSAFDGTSSRAISSWRFMPNRGDIYQQELARTQFEQEHRFSIAASYDFKTGPLGHSIGVYYNAESGRPYSLLMGGDPNTDGYTNDDLLFVPRSADSVVICPSGTLTGVSAANPCGTTRSPIPYTTFANYLSSIGVNPTAGEILKRNTQFEPWSREMDLHYALDLPVKFASVQLTADVLNVLNLFDKNAGVVRFVSNQTFNVVNYNPAASTSAGKLVYQEPTTQIVNGQRVESVETATGPAFSTFSNPNGPFSTANLRSRWQARWGVRVSF